jgi:hypothetical protein
MGMPKGHKLPFKRISLGARNTEADYWNKVDIGQPDECWPWVGGTFLNGYGQFNYDLKTQLTHRLALKFAGVHLPDDRLACHRCDNPSCCNPFHLFVGTHADNNADMRAKGRGSKPPTSKRKGILHPLAKLNEDQVLAIRAFSGTHRQAGEAFGVSEFTAKSIRQRQSWKHI